MIPLKNAKGITLIELLIVIVIMSIIATITVIAVGNIVSNTRLEADRANVITLNNATRLYRLQASSDEIFYNSELSSEDLMEILHEQGFISNIITPLTKEYSFIWSIELQSWILSDLMYIVGSQSDGLSMQANRDGWLTGNYHYDASDIVIPRTLQGELILCICGGVFRYYGNENETQLSSVIFAGNSELSSIGNNAFWQHTTQGGLTSIVFPSTLSSIGNYAFRNHMELTTITIGENVTIGTSAFHRDDAFKTAYETHGAGTYQYIDGVWEHTAEPS